MKAISFLTQRLPRRTRFGSPAVARLVDFDRGVSRKSTMNPGQSASFHFASSEYERCFRDLPEPNVGFLKGSSIAFLDAFDKQLWHDDPVSAILAQWILISLTAILITLPLFVDIIISSPSKTGNEDEIFPFLGELIIPIMPFPPLFVTR